MSDEEEAPLVIDQSSLDDTKQAAKQEGKMETEPAAEQGAPLKSSDPEPEVSSSEKLEDKPEPMDETPSSPTEDTAAKQPAEQSEPPTLLSDSKDNEKEVHSKENDASDGSSEAGNPGKESTQMEVTTTPSAPFKEGKTDTSSVMKDNTPSGDATVSESAAVEDSPMEDITREGTDAVNTETPDTSSDVPAGAPAGAPAGILASVHAGEPGSAPDCALAGNPAGAPANAPADNPDAAPSTITATTTTTAGKPSISPPISTAVETASTPPVIPASVTTDTPAISTAIPTTVTPAVTSSSTPVTPAVTSSSTPVTPAVTPAVTSLSTPVTPAVTSSSTPVTPAVASLSTPVTPAVTGSSTPVTPAVTSSSTPVTPVATSTDTPGGGSVTPRSRVTRSRNPDFAAKQKSFMKEYHRSVSGNGGGGGSSTEVTPDAPRPEKRAGSEDSAPPAKRRRQLSRGSDEPTPDAASSAASAGGPKRKRGALNDNFCWVCHREGQVVCCETCPRVFHLKCAQLTADPPGDWVCGECRRLVEAETSDRRLPAGRLQQLLKYAIGRLKGLPGAEPFLQPVDERKFVSYREYICRPMDLATMERNIERRQYATTEAFVADCKWILHNCILFNGTASKLTTLAKSLLRMCKWEMEEIETCPDCYGNAYVSDSWFTLACPHPHLLIWARLKGFPFWPAKAVKTRDGNVDCRFFGRHDRAWVPAKECFLFSREPPTPPKNRTKSLDACVEELEEHVKNLEKRFGKYIFAKPKTQYDPKRVEAQLIMTLPGYEGRDIKPTTERSEAKRSNSEIQLEILERLRQDKKARQTGGEPETAAAASPETASSPPPEPAEPTDSTNTDTDPGAGTDADAGTGTGTGTGTGAGTRPADRPDQEDQEEPSRGARKESKDSDQSQPAKSDAEKADSVKPETVKKEAAKTEPAKVGASTPETAKVKTTNPETTKAEATKTEPTKTSALKAAESAKATAAKADPPKATPTKADIPKATPTKADIPKATPTKADPPKAIPAKADIPKAKSAAVKSEPAEPAAAPVKRRSESGTTSEEEEPRPRRRTARKSLSAAATASACASAVSAATSAVPSPATAATAARTTAKSSSNPAIKPSNTSGGTGLQASRLLARLSASAAAKTKPQTSALTTIARSTTSRVLTVTSPKTPSSVAVTAAAGKSTVVRVAGSGAPSTAARPTAVTSGATPSIQVCRPAAQTKVNAVTNNGVTQQVLTAPLRPKLLTTSGSSSRPPAPVTSTAPQPSIIVNRGSARLMIPRASLNQLYLPGGPAGGTLTSSAQLGPMMVIPGGLGAATNGTTTTVVTYPAVSPAAAPTKTPLTPAAPAEAGPVSAMVEKQTQELADTMRRGVEKMLGDLSASDCSAATVASLRLQMERMEWHHKAELAEQKKAAGAQIAELKATMAQEQKKAAAKLSSTLAAETKSWERRLEQRVSEVKKKQWCAHCGKEAIFYCCWNTSYCDFPCQEAQWPKHMLTCANQQGNSAAAADGGGGDTDAGRLQAA